MKSLFSVMVLVLCIGIQGFATTDTTKTKRKKSKKTEQVRIILTPGEEKLFNQGKLGEHEKNTPYYLYSTTEQLIFSEQVRQTRKNN